MYENLSMPVDLRKIEVYGSHTKLVEAEQAVLKFTISGQHSDSRTVMAWLAGKTGAVEQALGAWENLGIRSSRTRLVKRTRKVKDRTAAFEDYYVSSVEYWVTTSETDKVTEMHLKLVELGVTEIEPTVFVSPSLKRHYGEVRRKAMKAARDKAELYCKEAGVRVGPPISIRDLNPGFSEIRSISRDGMKPESSGAEITEVNAPPAGPGLIPVTGALQVVFEILVG